MKRAVLYILAAVAGVVLAVSCSPNGTDGGEDFDKSFLYAGGGEWTLVRDFGDGPQEMLHKFNSDGTGHEINITAEQTEPQTFRWSLTGSRLTLIHNISMGGSVPEDCTVTTLSATRLVYKTESGVTVSCTKKQ